MIPSWFVLMALRIVEAAGAAQSSTCYPVLLVERPAHRDLPHTLYDQGIATLRVTAPRHEVLVGRRAAWLGSVEYALLVYRESPTALVTLAAVAVTGGRAWNLDATCAADTWAGTLVHVLERIAELPRLLDEPSGGPSAHREPSRITDQAPQFTFAGVHLYSDLAALAVRHPTATRSGEYLRVATRDSLDYYAIEVVGTGRARWIHLQFGRPDSVTVRAGTPRYPPCARYESLLENRYGPPAERREYHEESMPRRDSRWLRGGELLQLSCFGGDGRGWSVESLHIAFTPSP